MGGLFSAETPSGGMAQLDPTSAQIAQRQKANAGMSAGQITQQNMAGTQGAQGLLQTQPQAQHEQTALGMAQPSDLNDVLNQRAQQRYAGSNIALTNKENMQAGDIIANRQKAAMSTAEQQESMHEQQYQVALQNEMAKRKARSQMIGNILGIAGLAGGAALGGAGGASTGANVGSQIGTAVSQ